METREEILALTPEESDIWGLAWSPNGTRLAVGLSDGGLAVWDLDQVRSRLAEFGLPMPSTAYGGAARTYSPTGPAEGGP
jgi:WD40 repeat protein